MRDLNQMTVTQAVMLLDAKTSELEQSVKDDQDLHGPPMRPVIALAADIALIGGLLAEFIERFDSRLVILEAHMENLIERTYELEGGDSASE